jgi:hypothetical protein
MTTSTNTRNIGESMRLLIRVEASKKLNETIKKTTYTTEKIRRMIARYGALQSPSRWRRVSLHANAAKMEKSKESKATSSQCECSFGENQ